MTPQAGSHRQTCWQHRHLSASDKQAGIGCSCLCPHLTGQQGLALGRLQTRPRPHHSMTLQNCMRYCSMHIV